MADNTINITRRKILASIGTVGAAGAAAGYGTSALFSDEEEFENNTLAAGELDLVVDWEEHYSFPQLYGFDDPTDGLDVTRSEPTDSSDYVGLPDPMNPVVWVDEDDLDDYMSNTAIEAFPDPDNDGEQEVSTDSFTYEPCTDGANLPDDLDVNGLRTDNAHTDPEDDGGSPPLIQLEDVKPGDFGEFTLSFHLCDNPGYVWLQAANDSESGGANPEPEQEAEGGDGNDPTLAEKIETIWWYDARGDNVPPRTDCEEMLYLSDSGTDSTSLFEVELNENPNPNEANLTELLGPNDYDNAGNFNQVDAIAATPNGDKVILYDKNSGHLGEYDVASDGFTDKGDISGDPGNVVLAGYSPDGTLWAASQGDNNLYTVDTSTPSANSKGDTGIDLSGADLAFAADGTMYIWTSSSSQNGLYKVDDPSSDTTAVAVGSTGNKPTDVTGMAIRAGGSGNIVVSDNNSDEIKIVDRTNGNITDGFSMKSGGEDYDHIFGDMTAGQLCGQVFHRSDLRSDLDALTSSPVPLDGNRSTSFDEFPVSDPDNSPDRECFAAGVTHYIGFGWWVPTDVGNEIMGDTVEFDLGFYTEQCRNNDGSLGS